MAQKKTSSKRIGLKSIFQTGKKAYLAGFGKNNKNIIEKKYFENSITNETEVPAFDARLDENLNFILEKNHLSANYANPVFQTKKKDFLKENLEKFYFGNISNGNIPIQIAYYARSIEKLFALYINDIIYAIDNLNLNRKTVLNIPLNDFGNDVLGNDISVKVWFSALQETIKKGKDFSSKEEKNHFYKAKRIIAFLKNINCYEGLFENLFNKVTVDSGLYGQEAKLNQIYKTMQVIAFIRNNLIHGENNIFKRVENNNVKTTAFEIYKNAQSVFLKSFKENSQTNVFILNKIYGTDISNCYFDFAYTKDYKNIGISIKKIREQLFEIRNTKEVFGVEEFSKIKSKLNTLYDFSIQHFLKENDDYLNSCVSSQREALEDYKEENYSKMAHDMNKQLAKELMTIDNICLKFESFKKDNEKSIKQIIFNVDEKTFSQNTIIASFVYVMCRFLNEKEINEFVTGLINNLTNIQSLVETLKQLEPNSRELNYFNQTFEAFNDIDELIVELQTIITVSKQRKIEIKKARKNRNLKMENNDCSYDYLNEAYVLLSDESLSFDEVKENVDLCKFLRNNIIKSNKFSYILRYNNLKNCKLLFQNKEFVKYIISSQVSKTQLERHFEIARTFNVSVHSVDELCESLKTISLKEIISKNNSPEYSEFLKSLIQLYMTIIYLATKSMVRINSLYCIAWLSYEQDTFYYLKNPQKVISRFNIGQNNQAQNNKIEYNNSITTRALFENKLYGKHNETFITYLREHFICLIDEKEVFKIVRNNVMHLTVIDKFLPLISKYNSKNSSYFSLYNFVLQTLTCDEVEELSYCKKNFLLKGNYSKDMVQILNMPFAYNIARFKALTNEKIFEKVQKFGK